MTITDRDAYYCNQKFWWLSVDLEKSRLHSCCAASPHKIDLDWLSQNPGKLFDDPVFMQERQQMLQNEVVSSCESSCWKPESQQLISRRISMQGYRHTHSNLSCTPSTLNVIMGTQCNMACVYCCKNYSSTWRNDILNMGDYSVSDSDDRYKKNKMDLVLQRLSMNEISTTDHRQQVQKAMLHPDHVRDIDTVLISGGEPFLYDEIVEIANAVPGQVQIISGLGLNPKRLAKILDSLPQSRISIIISAESVGATYEFVRQGNTWSRFLENFKLLRSSGMPLQFNATLSNVTVFGLASFLDFAGDIRINYQCCTDPGFLSINVMDSHSKRSLQQSLSTLPEVPKNMISEVLDVEPLPQQILDFRNFIGTFVARRKLSINIFPENFVSWINQ